MTAGVKTFINLWGREFKLDPIWRVPLYSSERTAIGQNEEACYDIARSKLKDKYYGFRVMGIETIE